MKTERQFREDACEWMAKAQIDEAIINDYRGLPDRYWQNSNSLEKAKDIRALTFDFQCKMKDDRPMQETIRLCELANKAHAEAYREGEKNRDSDLGEAIVRSAWIIYNCYIIEALRPWSGLEIVFEWLDEHKL